MKILHLAQDHDDALVAARVLHGIAQNVTLARETTPAGAIDWLHGNRNTSAVIVEVQAQSCAAFVQQVRGIGLSTAIVVVSRFPRLEPARRGSRRRRRRPSMSPSVCASCWKRSPAWKW